MSPPCMLAIIIIKNNNNTKIIICACTCVKLDKARSTLAVAAYAGPLLRLKA